MVCGGVRIKGKNNLDFSKTIMTVITVVYNAANCLEKTIQSVINQTYKNIEYIIVDGGSNDGTLDIIRKYEDRITYWQSESDNGIYDAMNKAVNLTTGEWINFMNAGDIFYNGYVIESVNNLIKKNDDIVYGNSFTYDNILLKIKNPSLWNMLCERMVCHQSIFARRKLFDEYHFDTNYKIVADRKWIAICLRNNKKIRHLNIPVNYYDLNGVSGNRIKYYKESQLLQKELYGILGLFFTFAKRFIKKIKLKENRNK